MEHILDPILRALVARANANSTLSFPGVSGSSHRRRRPHGPHYPKRFKVKENGQMVTKRR